jgi:hypothetical protein
MRSEIRVMMERRRDVKDGLNVPPAIPGIPSERRVNASLHGPKQRLLPGEKRTRTRSKPSRRRRRNHNDNGLSPDLLNLTESPYEVQNRLYLFFDHRT